MAVFCDPLPACEWHLSCSPDSGQTPEGQSPLSLSQPLKHQLLSTKSRGTEAPSDFAREKWLLPWYCSPGAALLLTFQLHPNFSDHFVFDFQLMLQLVPPSWSSWKLHLLSLQDHYRTANTEEGKSISAKNIWEIPTLKDSLSIWALKLYLHMNCTAL